MKLDLVEDSGGWLCEVPHIDLYLKPAILNITLSSLSLLRDIELERRSASLILLLNLANT
jgi:hypothetical protein